MSIIIREAFDRMDFSLLDNCLLGEVMDIDRLSNVFLVFQAYGLLDRSIKYIGGILALLDFGSTLVANVFLKYQKYIRSRWFARIKE